MHEYMDRTLLHGNLETLVLAVLAKKEIHGYAIRWLLNDKSGGRIQASYGRIYPLLQKLQRTGLAKRRVVKAGETRTRGLYTITPHGRAELARRVFKWKQFARAMARILPDR